MLRIAHRGRHLEHPENTLAAFAAARAAGAQGIETDVRRSADGLPVLFHDRLTGDGRAVADLTREELAAAAGYPVPTLDEALAADDGGDLIWNVEIKTAAAAAAAGEVIARFAALRRIVVTSFQHALVAPLAAIPGVEGGGLLLASRPAVSVLAELGKTTGLVVWHYEALDVELLARAADHGLRSWVYAVEGPAEHRRCVELAAAGLGAVITDRVDLLP